MASAVLFAHDHAFACSVIKNSLEAVDEQNEQDILQQQHAEFFNYVVAQWADEMKSQVEIGFELLDKKSLVTDSLTTYDSFRRN